MNLHVKELAGEQFDPLDMHNYRMENLPVREKSKIEQYIAMIGVPLAIIAFIVIMWVIKLPFLENIDPSTLGKAAQKAFNENGAAAFSRTNVAMFAVFVSSVILWMTEAIPNYLTSLILIITRVFA